MHDSVGETTHIQLFLIVLNVFTEFTDIFVITVKRLEAATQPLLRVWHMIHSLLGAGVLHVSTKASIIDS